MTDERIFWYRPCPARGGTETHDPVGDVDDGPCMHCGQRSVQEPMPPEGDPETWDEMASRVTSEVVNIAYATSLANSMKAYMQVGFTYEQSWALTADEHRARLDMMGQRLMMNGYDNGEDGP